MSWKSFLYGAARCLDLFGVLDPPVDLPKTDEEAFKRDLDALRRGHDAITHDILAAIREPQCENYSMSEAEAKALQRANRIPRPTMLPKQLPSRDEQSVFIDPPTQGAK